MGDPLEGVTASGTIATGAHRTRIPEPYEPVVQAARAGVCAADDDASLYLYGSVANGTAVIPHSDVDLLTIDLDPAEAAHLADELSAAFRDLCLSVDIAPARTADYGTDYGADDDANVLDEAYGNRVFLRHYCVHLGGPQRHLGWPEFPADARAARGFNGDIARRARRWRQDFADGSDPSELARRAARKTLLAIAGIVSVHDGGWTTDRTKAADRWSQLRPEFADATHLLVGWAAGAIATVDQLGDALDGVIRVVTDEFDRSIGLWTTA